MISPLEPHVPNPLVEFYRCPEPFVSIAPSQQPYGEPGYFAFGPDAICYGQSTCRSSARINGSRLPDLINGVDFDGSALRLPFSAAKIVENLRFERYPTNVHGTVNAWLSSESIRRVYYTLRPMLDESLRRTLQRLYFRDWTKLPFPRWPLDTSVEHILERLLLLSMKGRRLDRVPFIWFWPDGAHSAAVVTHDVETTVGLNFVSSLMDIDDSFGIKGAFQLVPEQRYSVPKALLVSIRERQCEINVHGLNHDGNLFRNRDEFLKQAERINHYMEEFGAAGFRAACMYRNVDWYDKLNISYDMSVPNVAHLEPQRGGCCTVFPYFIGKSLELPLTAVEDYSLFNVLGDYSIELWKKQIALIMAKHGLMSFVVHPDYVLSEKPLGVYKELLGYLSNLREQQGVWVTRPGDVNRWWRERSEMRLVSADGQWKIEGAGRERARLGFASIENDQIVYRLGDDSKPLATSEAS